MADNVVINPGSGGQTVRTVQRGGGSGPETQVVLVDQNTGGSEDLTSAFRSQGDLGAGNADSGNPVKIGSKAVALGTDPTPAAAGQRQNAFSDVHGRLLVAPAHPNLKRFHYRGSGPVSANPLATPASGHKIVVHTLHLVTPNGNTTDIDVKAGLGSADGSIYDNPGMTNKTHDSVDGDIPGTADQSLLLTIIDGTSNQQYACFGTYYELPA